MPDSEPRGLKSGVQTHCPECGMPITRGRTTSIDMNEDSDTYGEVYDSGGYVHWTCAGLIGSGAGSPACKRIAALCATLEGAASAIDCWKVPLLDPDGRDSSEAVMRLLANDMRKAVRDA